jgi:hypothetical protein
MPSVRSFVSSLIKHVKKQEEEEDETNFEAVSVWRRKRELENEFVTKARHMITQDPWRAYKAISKSMLLADQVARGELEIMNEKYPGFPILEFQVGKLKGKPWFNYLTWVSAKSCFLLLSEGRCREEARRRALIWMEHCKNKSTHGQPVFIDLTGKMLEDLPLRTNEKESVVGPPDHAA